MNVRETQVERPTVSSSSSSLKMTKSDSCSQCKIPISTNGFQTTAGRSSHPGPRPHSQTTRCFLISCFPRPGEEMGRAHSPFLPSGCCRLSSADRDGDPVLPSLTRPSGWAGAGVILVSRLHFSACHLCVPKLPRRVSASCGRCNPETPSRPWWGVGGDGHRLGFGSRPRRLFPRASCSRRGPHLLLVPANTSSRSPRPAWGIWGGAACALLR